MYYYNRTTRENSDQFNFSKTRFHCVYETLYCKLKNVLENLTSTYSVKRHICNLKKLQLGFDLPTSINDRDTFVTFREGFYFHKISHLRSFVKIKPSQIFLNLQYCKTFFQPVLVPRPPSGKTLPNGGNTFRTTMFKRDYQRRQNIIKTKNNQPLDDTPRLTVNM